MGQPRPLFSFIFGLFKQTIQFLQQINVKNIRDLNLQPIEHELSPLTTRLGLPPFTESIEFIF